MDSSNVSVKFSTTDFKEKNSNGVVIRKHTHKTITITLTFSVA